MANEDPIQDDLERFERIQPYIARMGMSVGFVWSQWDTEARAAIMDMVDGSPGLDAKIVEWAEEFDEMWEARGKILNNNEVGDFPEQIANFVDAKIKSLMVEARLTQ